MKKDDANYVDQVSPVADWSTRRSATFPIHIRRGSNARVFNAVPSNSANPHHLHCYSKYRCFDMHDSATSCDKRSLELGRDDQHLLPTECLDRSALGLALTDASTSPTQ
jgi:hypothetical protein